MVEYSERPAALDVVGLVKSFGGSRALDAVDFTARAGEVHALLGQNGCGKSTLVKILAGIHAPDAGTATVDGEELDLGSASAARSLGIRFVHQDLGLIHSASTVENMAFGRPFRRRRGLIDWRAEARRAAELVQQLGYDFDVQRTVGDLAVSERVGVAVARALDSIDLDELKVIFFDEPTAAMPEPEARRFFAMVERLRTRGVAVVFISHRLDEVLAVADHVTVLRDGHVTGHHRVADLDGPTLVRLIVGEIELPTAPLARTHGDGQVLVAVEHLRGGSVDDVSFSVRAGEVVGFAGLVGSGMEMVARLVYGAARPASGTVCIDGHSVTAGSPAESARAGVGFIPADRKRLGALGQLSVRENLVLSDVRRHTRWGLLDARAESRDVAAWIRRFDVRPADAEMPIQNLSGGNQQKVILARWLRRSPRLLLLDEPTQGIDVGAKAQIYELIRTAADEGLAVVVCSGDTEELERICDRVFAMRNGHVAAELVAPDISRSAIDHAILAVTTEQESA